MIHITLTGPHAGQILCGKSRCEVEDGDRTAHWPYSMTREQEVAFRAQVCPDCLKEWDAAEPETPHIVWQLCEGFIRFTTSDGRSGSQPAFDIKSRNAAIKNVSANLGITDEWTEEFI